LFFTLHYVTARTLQ
ncbi:phosphoglucose isomerase family protein, partial [Vibrio parahaemolyticus EKP-028]